MLLADIQNVTGFVHWKALKGVMPRRNIGWCWKRRVARLASRGACGAAADLRTYRRTEGATGPARAALATHRRSMRDRTTLGLSSPVVT
jgi:hypothetical protein